MRKIFFQILVIKKILLIFIQKSVMPKNKKAWSSWNSSIDDNEFREKFNYILVKFITKFKV